MNKFLYNQNVDVSRSFALLFFIGTAWSLIVNLSNLVINTFHLDLTFIITFPLAVGLWKYKSGARKFLLIIVWIMVTLGLILFVYGFLGGENFTLTVGKNIISNPTRYQTGFFLILWIIVSTLLLLVVHSKKFKEEVHTQPVAGGDATR